MANDSSLNFVLVIEVIEGDLKFPLTVWVNEEYKNGIPRIKHQFFQFFCELRSFTLTNGMRQKY